MTPRRSAPESPRPEKKKRGARDTGQQLRAERDAPGFVPLANLKRASPDPDTAFKHIQTLYFNTTKRTIEADLSHAIELLKSLPSEASRERATVYMDGLAQMKRDWARKDRT